MNTLKTKIQKQIVDPATHNRRVYSGIATVTQANESINTCSINFIDKDGKRSNIDNVRVITYNSSLVDWFPVVGDYVVVEMIENQFLITGRAQDGYASTQRLELKLKQDVLPNMFIDTMGGMIF